MYYSISQDGMHNYVTMPIFNQEDIKQAIDRKNKHTWEYLSISGVTNKIDCNPAAPLFIYGAMMCYIICDQDKNVIYNAWLYSTHCEKITSEYLQNFKP